MSQFIQHCCENKHNDHPAVPHDPQWILFFLADRSKALNWKLPSQFFKHHIADGQVIFLFDGLDEVPERRMREKISQLVEQAVKVFARCRFVLTSRPQAWTGRAVLDSFFRVTIDPLTELEMENFLKHWSAALFPGSKTKSDQHYAELSVALQSRPEIRNMARNPVMLTALAVVHWNERRLPEQRSDLYESIITWLLRSREQRPGRLPAEQCGVLLRNLAFEMLHAPGGRQVQVGPRAAAEKIEKLFDGKTAAERLTLAERFLAEEEVDSGIVVARANQLTFWHLTFQEFLAAKALGGKVEPEQKKILINPAILHSPEWREVLLLYSGVLFRQGSDKLDNFFNAVLDLADTKNTLTEQARCVGLIGAMLRDLSPFHYKLTDARYQKMLTNVMAIFDKATARSVPLKTRLEAADALGQAGDLRLTGDNMVEIPAGSFWMGAQKKDRTAPNYDDDAYADESPVHQVKLSAFKISCFPVTVVEYKKFIDDGGYENKACWEAGGWAEFKKPGNWEQQLQYPNRPVVEVCWYEAMAYAAWAGLSLPSEAQWERAARGAGETYRKFPWGNNLPDAQTTNWNKTGFDHASPVGMFPDDCSAEGLLDMGGNVWEWCRDWRDVDYNNESLFYQKSEGSIDPLNAKSGLLGKVGDRDTVVVRGGSWNDSIELDFRCAYRNYYRPHDRNSNVGFRVVCSSQLCSKRVQT